MANEPSIKEWADAWILMWSGEVRDLQRDEFEWAVDNEFDAIFSDPELVW